ncbi:MAG TPA: VOC family protein [Solirubrobacteraceae bacterium]|nr:VOC family protein [Solirubrobacteraceae bacterium]
MRLRVADLARVRDYYERTIGLRVLDENGDTVTLGADAPLVELVGDPAAQPAPPGSTGLFHLAILVPSRPELARSIRRVVDSGERFTGASDHFVSEALYLRDPEGNGIEIYRDRPREQWEYEPDGQLRMGTVALDIQDIVAEMPADEDSGMPDGTIMGHVHLHVSDLGEAEAFYVDRLGLDVTVRGYPGALFVSHDGYHHHVGLNTWQGAHGPAPPPGSRGLIDYELFLKDVAEGPISDPAGNGVVVRA